MIRHAHIDPIARVPLLARRGFAGPIFIQQTSGEPMQAMLLDSVSIAKSDADGRDGVEIQLAMPGMVLPV